MRFLLKPNEPAALWAISMDSPEQSREFAGTIASDGMGRVTFTMLSDPQHRVIDAYGLQDPRYIRQRVEGIPWPATYVIDKAGRVAWVRIDKDHTRRPPNSEIRAALDALK